MIKILFFIDSISGGGAEKVLRNLIIIDERPAALPAEPASEVE